MGFIRGPMTDQQADLLMFLTTLFLGACMGVAAYDIALNLMASGI